jgi:ADP-heptose:LPS heptosyltransferase
MNIDLQRWIDRWVGIPLCAAVSAFAALGGNNRAQTPARPRAIVVILLSEMGSLVLAHDMFARLRQRYPDAPLHALLFHKNREILDLMQVMPADNIHTVDDRSLPALAGSLWRGVQALRRAGVDVAIDCELFSRISSLLSFASGAAVRVGFHRHTQEGLYRGSHINRPVPYNPYQHISAQFLALARAIDSTAVPKSKLAITLSGTPPPLVRLDAALVPAIRERMRSRFPSLTGKPLVLVYPGGGILPIRAWPLASYAALCTGLVADGCAVAVIGLSEDTALAQQLVADVQQGAPGAPVVDLTGFTRSVAELLALFHHARLLVTNDGGPGQFAALTPISTLMLFGPETPGLYAPLTPRCFSFYSHWPCSPCLTAYNHRASYCDGDNQCLKVIAPDAVLAKARECLAAGASATAAAEAV